jgi:hypothetical protein
MDNKTCYNCGTEACIFETDVVNNIMYYMCRECGKVWRVVDGILPSDEVKLDDTEMLDYLPLKVFEAYTEAAIRLDMSDCVHKCFVCRSPAFEVELGTYKCSNTKCNFEWESERG